MARQSLTFIESYGLLWVRFGNQESKCANLCTWLFLNANIFLHMVVYVVRRPIDAFHSAELYPFFLLGLLMGGFFAWLPLMRRQGRIVLMILGSIHGFWVMMKALQTLHVL